MANKIQSFESLALINGKPNSVFYTNKKDKDITAIASYYGKKILTERLIIISGSKDKPKAETITRVTIIKDKSW